MCQRTNTVFTKSLSSRSWVFIFSACIRTAVGRASLIHEPNLIWRTFVKRFYGDYLTVQFKLRLEKSSINPEKMVHSSAFFFAFCFETPCIRTDKKKIDWLIHPQAVSSPAEDIRSVSLSLARYLTIFLLFFQFFRFIFYCWCWSISYFKRQYQVNLIAGNFTA